MAVKIPNVRTHVPTLRSQENASGATVAAATSTIQDALDQLAKEVTKLQSATTGVVATISPEIGVVPANGNAVTASQASMTSGSAAVHVVTGPALATADVGKVMLVNGAGVSGAALQATILSVSDSSHATLSTNAAATVTNVYATWGTDRTAEIQATIDSFSGVQLPVGRYLVLAQLTIINRLGFKFFGLGDGSVLIPGSHIANNFIDVSGTTDLEISHFQIEGRHYPDASFECIYGDGTVANPTYGNIRIRYIRLANWKPLGYGIGANSPNVAQDVTYEGNLFYNCGAGSFGANLIDTGSSGTKLRFKIIHNRFVYIDQPVTAPGNAIFAGHGINKNFDISHNSIDDCPTTGIAIYNRPFAGEATSHSGTTCIGNVIRNSGWNGITNFGADNVVIANNTVVNPGKALGVDETRCGIYVSDQQTGASTFLGGANVVIANNVLIDDQGSHTMRFGVLETTIGSSPTSDSSGQISNNTIIGQSVADVQVLSKFAAMRVSGTSLAAGKSAAVAPLNVRGNLRAEGPTGSGTGLFMETSMESAVSAGNFVLGQGFNLRFDGTNWVGGTDGGSNGYGAILLDYGGDLFMLAGGKKTGGSAQTVAPSTLIPNHVFFAIDWNGKIISIAPHAFIQKVGIGLGFTGSALNPTMADAGYLLDIGSGGHVRLRNGSHLGIGGDADVSLPLSVYGGAKLRGSVEITTGNLTLDDPAGAISAFFGGFQQFSGNNSAGIAAGSFISNATAAVVSIFNSGSGGGLTAQGTPAILCNGKFVFGVAPPSYASNAAAVAGGLHSGDVYTVTGSNPLQLAMVA